MIDPDILRYLDKLKAKQPISPNASLEDIRARYEAVAREMRMPTPEGIETDEVCWVESIAGPVRVRVFRNKTDTAQPALIFMHGGGWMQGSPETHWDITARIAAWAGITVISVDYALAPEFPYPIAFEHCWSVLKWAFSAQEIGIDNRRIAVGGDSAGGNLAAAIALRARDEGVALAAQLLIYPVCDFDRTRPSYLLNAEGPLLTSARMAEVSAWYSPDADNLTSDPFVAPLVAPSHVGLPPAFIGVAQFDPVRDSGAAYAEALVAAGVEVEFDAGEGLIHGYARSLGDCSAAARTLEKMAAWLKSKLR